jgi:hypothetical protein
MWWLLLPTVTGKEATWHHNTIGIYLSVCYLGRLCYWDGNELLQADREYHAKLPFQRIYQSISDITSVHGITDEYEYFYTRV